MIKDSDLPPLQQLFPVADPTFTMRCMTDDALRTLQREAFKAGLEKAAQVCDLMGRTSPRKPFQEASAWLAQRIRGEKSGRPTSYDAAGRASTQVEKDKP